MVKKPTETNLWTEEDIKDVKERLPKGVQFGTLAGNGKTVFKLDLGTEIDIGNSGNLMNNIEIALAEIIKIEKMTLTAQYCGSNNPHVVLEIHMSE